MVGLLASGDRASLDYASLREYLSDMAKRDRREVESRLAVLLAHLLKWNHQPERRSPSWRGTIIEQRQELRRLAGRGVLRKHAETVLPEVYHEAVERAAAETGLPATAFPAECGYTFGELLSVDPGAQDAHPGNGNNGSDHQ